MPYRLAIAFLLTSSSLLGAVTRIESEVAVWFAAFIPFVFMFGGLDAFVWKLAIRQYHFSAGTIKIVVVS